MIVYHIIFRRNEQCLPITVESRGVKGNVLVAVRDIKPFETVLIDKPAIVGPFDDTFPQCLECYKEVQVDNYQVDNIAETIFLPSYK